MITIRLARGGRKGRPFYHIVVADKRAPRDGRFLETLGYYNPIRDSANEEVISINTERVAYWISVGAEIKERVKQILKRQAKTVKAKQA